MHEVAATGTPAILVPWAGAADDHQTDNVAWLSEVGAAVLVDEAAWRDGALGTEIERLRGSAEERQALADAARRRGEVHRSGALASLIREVALTSRPS